MAAAQPVKYTTLNANQIKGFWAAWGGWCLDGMDAFIYALVLAPALAELLPQAELFTLFHEPNAMPASIERRTARRCQRRRSAMSASVMARACTGS